MYTDAPWLKFYGDVEHTINYPKATMCELLFQTSRRYPAYTAYDFMGKTSTYEQLANDVRTCARGLRALGIKEDDRVTVCLPNTPQTIIIFYAINLIGAVASMIHPLSSEGEIKFFLNDSNSVCAITLDAFYPKFKLIRKETKLKYMLITGIKDYLSPIKKIGFSLTSGRKIKAIDQKDGVVYWKDLMAMQYNGTYAAKRDYMQPAAILYSGGTTGTTKGILLSNANINATALQTIAMGECVESGKTMLAVLPMFHGFGLCICVHCMMIMGVKCLLVPRFTPDSFAELVRKHKPNYIAGVPSLYEALLRHKAMDGCDLSCLLGVFVGGDSLSVDLKHRFEKFLKEHNSNVALREGYGTTECVTASCISPKNAYREGAIGLPLSDTYYKICKPFTTEDVAYDTEGEICISGPSVMMEYINQPEETANTLKTHADGRTWLHTGDLGMMDSDGYVYFKQRLKRMIISSGYNIYPSQIENILDTHELVSISCVIGVKDPIKIQKVKAFVVLMPGVQTDGNTKNKLFEYLMHNVAKYAMPYDIEFRDNLPLTLVGKVAYTKLEEEETDKFSEDEISSEEMIAENA